MENPFKFQSWEIGTSVQGAVNLPHDMSSTEARRLLLSYGFDQAPVMRGERLFGWVRTAHLGGRGRVGSHAMLLDESAILSRDTPLADTLHGVVSHGLVFLAGTGGIGRFVVFSDLDRHAVRCYLYILVSELEMLMADRVAATLTQEEIIKCFGESAAQRYDAAEAKGQEIRAVEYLYFLDYARLAKRVPSIASAFPGEPKRLPHAINGLNRLRNCVAHPSRSLTAEFAPEEVSELARLTDSFIAQLHSSGTVAAED
jgi:hypothetical protein